jgi:hypothetical protein
VICCAHTDSTCRAAAALSCCSCSVLTPQEAFSELDKDGDGHLTPGELHAALRNTGALAKAGLAAEIDPHVLEVRHNHNSTPAPAPAWQTVSLFHGRLCHAERTNKQLLAHTYPSTTT